jgi:hypothetical protein
MAFQTEAAGRRADGPDPELEFLGGRQAIGLKPPTISALLRLISARFNLVV